MSDAAGGVPGDSRRAQGPDSPTVELGHILDELDRARRRASERSGTLVARVRPTSDAAVLPPTVAPVPVAPVAVPAAPERAEGVRAVPTEGRSGLLARSRRLARPAATVIVTTTLVLCGWLLVLEPALGSRPVLVMDDGMSPALRIGDVAFAEEPSGPLASGAIVAVRLDGRVDVSRLIDRAQAAPGASPEERAAAPLVIRDDAEGLEVRTVVPRDALIGVIGAAVPRVGLPAVWLRAPTTAPLGTLVVLLLLGVTGLGVADGVRERTAVRRDGDAAA
jgi:hypothetical protein